MKYHNVVVPISNYNTEFLQKALTDWGKRGYRLVNTVMANNGYQCLIMYLFFTKEMTEKEGGADNA